MMNELSTDSINKDQDGSHNRVLNGIISGFGAGFLTTIACAPFDILKIRLQVQGSLKLGHYQGGAMNMFRKIRREEGIKGLFRGIGPAMLTLPLFLGIYWPIYDSVKHSDSMANLCNHNLHLIHLSAAVIGEGISSIITNPLWVIRTRIQTDYLHQLSESSPITTKRTLSIRSVVHDIIKNEGFIGFTKGISASLIGLSFPAIQFPLCK